MPYGKGITFERKIANKLRAEGWLVMRSGASLSPFDLMAIKKETKEIKLIQCKKGWSFSDKFLKRLGAELSVWDDEYIVKTEVIHEE